MLRAWLGTALVAVVARALLTGSVVDVGLAWGGWAAAVVALGLGAGALGRRVPTLFDALTLAVAVVVRGPLAAGCVAVFGTGAFGVGVALVASLLVPAAMLGRFAGAWTRGPLGAVALGWATGEVLVITGLVAAWPGLATGPLAGLAAFALTRGLAASDETPDEPASDEPAPDPPPRRRASPDVATALLLGASLTLALLVLRRVIPGYASPTVHAGSEWLVVLLVPVAVIAALVAVIVDDTTSTTARVVRLLGGTALAGALVFVVYDASAGYQLNAHIGLTRSLRETTRTLALDRPWLAALEPWDLWVASFVGWPAVGAGLLSGALRGRAAGGFALGAALAFAGEWVVVATHPVFGPAWLLLASAGLALWAGVVGLVGPWGLLAAPLAAVPFVLRGDVTWVGFDEIRRPGELAVEAHARSVTAESAVFSSPRRGTTSPEGTLAYMRTSIGREPFFPVYEDAFAEFDAKVRRMEEEGREGLKRFYGVRYAGVTAHPGHPALGDDGSVGRMLRLFGTDGETLVVGYGAELVALDWTETGRAESIAVATPSADLSGERFGDYQLVVAALTETSGLPTPARGNVAAVLADAAADATLFDLVVVAPERPEWPGAGAPLSRERLASIADVLAPGGRCLAWIDTTSLDARSLRARLAAFGDVFGSRSLAFLEPREQDPPFVVAVGWLDADGDPRDDVLPPGATRGIELSGLRSTIRTREELADHLLVDGEGLARLAEVGPVHTRDHFVVPSRFAPAGWSAVRELYDPAARLGPDDPHPTDAPDAMPAWLDSLVLHDRYSMHLEFVNQTVVENIGDIDWDAYADEVARLAEAARLEPHHPLVQHGVASLGERLVINAEFTRFAELYEAVDGEAMESWRLELLKAAALDGMLDPDAALEALDRARELAGLDPLR